MTLAKWGTYKYFKREEFLCRCCGQEYMTHELIQALDDMRRDYGKPLRVNSGYRCPDYNASISSTGRTGPHTTGCAVDLGVWGADGHKILTLACNSGKFTGIGVNQKGVPSGRFIHLDILNRLEVVNSAGDIPSIESFKGARPNLWSY